MDEANLVLTLRLQVLAQLLVAHFDPQTERASRLRQCLTVFFPAYAGAGADKQQLLGRAMLPAVHQTLASSGKGKSPAPALLRFALQLLQVRNWGAGCVYTATYLVHLITAHGASLSGVYRSRCLT